MATIKNFEDLEIWKMARELDLNIFKYSKTSSFRNDSILSNQILRASGSVMDNIAEGFSRGGNKEFIYFLSISKASCAEVRSQLYRALDRNYLLNEEFEKMIKKTKLIEGKIIAFITYLNSSNFKGVKFKK